MRRISLMIGIGMLVVASPVFVGAQSSGPDTWVDYASGEYDIFRSITYVRAGLPPVITIHGDEDDVVPYAQAVLLHAALDKVGVPNQLVTVHGAKHDGFNRQTLVDSFAAIRGVPPQT